MKTFKRALSCFLALLMIFGSFSVLSYAALEDNDNISSQIYTKYFVDGVETNTVKAGDTVKARVYLATNYMLGCSTIFWVYPSEILEFDATSLSGAKDVGYGMMQYDAANAFNTVDGPAAAAKFTGYVVQQVGVTIDSYSAADDMVYEGFFTEEYFDDKGWIWLNIDGGAGSPQVFEPDADNVADDWIAEFTFIVKDTVVDGDEGYFHVPEESLINTTDHYYGKTGIQRAKSSSGFASTEAFDIDYNMDVSKDVNVVTVGTAVVEPTTNTVEYVYAGTVPTGYTAPASIELEEGAAIEEPEVTIPAGYKLTWTMTGDVDGKMGTEAVTMTGTWAKIDYPVDYVYAGDIPAGYTAPAATTATIGDAIVIPEVAAPAGYELAWTMSGDVNGAMGTETVTVTGTWTKKSTTITFSHTGSAPAGVTSESVTATYGEDAAEYITEYIDNNLKGKFPGYSVSGWTVVVGSTDNDGVYLVGEDPIAVEINWTKIPYTVSFAFEGTTPAGVNVPASFKTTVGEVIAAPAVEVPAGYELAWAVTGATANDDGTYTAGANKVSFVGTWSKLGYAVSYEFAGSVPAGYTAPANSSTTVGEVIAAPAVEVPAGYEFAWTVTGATANADGSYTAGANDVAFVGTWSKIEYAVNYAYAGEIPTGFTAPAAAKATIGDPIVVPTVEAPDGYTLTWTMSGDVDGAMGTETVTVTGTWAKNSYTITYYLSYEDQAEGNVYDTQTVKFGEKVELIDAEVPGNIFDGWDLEVDTMPAENLEAVAVLTPKVVYFYSIYGEVIFTMEEVDEITEADLPSAEDATEGEDVNFIEWQIIDETLETPYAVDSAEVEVYPYCTVDIVFYTDEDCETVHETLTFEYGYEITEEDIAAIGEPTKKGNTFACWEFDFVYQSAESNSETYAIYDANVYEATFIVNGEVYDTKEVTFGEAIELPEREPTLAGSTFVGWTNVEGGAALDEIIMDEEGMTLYPVFVENGKVAYTVEIYLMDETGAYAAPVKVGGTATIGTTVTAAHADYAQADYYLADTDNENNVFSAEVKADGSTVLALYYNRVMYDVTIGDETTKVPHGATITAPTEADNVPDGYELESWNDGAYKPGEEIEVTGPITFTPDFVAVEVDYTIKTYTMGLDGAYGEAEVGTFKAVTGTTVTYTAPVKEGFTADAESYSVVVNGNGKSEIIVKYARNQFDVVINGETTKVYYGETITAPTEAKDVPAGYELESWNDGAYKPGQEIEVTGPITFTPDFKAVEVKYTVEIYLENTDGDYVLADSIEETGVTATTATAAHADYAQAEYYVADTDNEKNVFSAEIKGDGSTVLALYYDLVKYDVTIGDETTKVPHGTTITVPTEADNVPDGYELESWNDGAYKPGEEIEVTGPITFTPDFKAVGVKYTVEIYLADAEGNYALADSIEETGVTGETATAAHADYAQAEYYLADMDADNKFSDVIAGNGSTVLALYFKRATYTVTYEDENGVVLDTATVVYGAAITAPDYTTPDGMTFLGWFNKETSEKMPATMPAKNVTYVVKFAAGDATPYTIQVKVMNVDGNSYVTTETQALGTTGATQTIVPDYSIEGFTVNENSVLSAEIKGDGTTVLTVIYDRNKYTAMFDGVKYGVFYGAALPEVEPAAQVGKEFAGWTPEVPAAMPAEDLEFTSTWTDVMYKLIYIINGEEEVYEYAAGAAVTPIADPTVSGMTFLGWNTEIPEVMPAEDVIVVAKFEAAVFKVTFLDADGNVYDEKAVKCGDEIIVPVTNPTKDYSVFQGWEGIPADGLMPAHDLTIYPIFEAIPVRLVAAAGSTTVINRETGIITGLTTKMDYELSKDYLAVEGDGYYTITAVGSFSRFGTGAIVEVWDNNAPEGADPVETFYIVIYGDVNGDSAVNSLDGSIVKSEALYDTDWSRGEVDTLKVMAADLVKDGKIKNADADIIYNTALGVTTIDQATGTVVR